MKEEIEAASSWWSLQLVEHMRKSRDTAQRAGGGSGSGGNGRPQRVQVGNSSSSTARSSSGTVRSTNSKQQQQSSQSSSGSSQGSQSDEDEYYSGDELEQALAAAAPTLVTTAGNTAAATGTTAASAVTATTSSSSSTAASKRGAANSQQVKHAAIPGDEDDDSDGRSARRAPSPVQVYTEEFLDGLQVEFAAQLRHLLQERFCGHWHTSNPDRGSGYRAIMIDNVQVDAVLLQALQRCAPWLERHRPQGTSSVNPVALARYLPHNVVMQCNPNRCCVRKLDGSWQISNVYIKSSGGGSRAASATSPMAPTAADATRGSPASSAAVATSTQGRQISA